jgi:glycosyltransferase involved in cell wall biosynthesis
MLDLFVLSSLAEGTPVSLLEAMASGVPAVVTNVGGNPVVVEQDRCGLVVDPKDIAGMAGAIRLILSDPGRAARYREAGLERMRRQYSLDGMVRRYTEIYHEMLGNKGRNSRG